MPADTVSETLYLPAPALGEDFRAVARQWFGDDPWQLCMRDWLVDALPVVPMHRPGGLGLALDAFAPGAVGWSRSPDGPFWGAIGPDGAGIRAWIGPNDVPGIDTAADTPQGGARALMTVLLHEALGDRLYRAEAEPEYDTFAVYVTMPNGDLVRCASPDPLEAYLSAFNRVETLEAYLSAFNRVEIESTPKVS